MRSVLVALVAVAALAGCGSSSGSTKASSSASTTTAKTSATVGASAFTSERCAKAIQSMADIAAKMPQAITGQAGDLKQSVQALQDMANAAPSEIRADMKVVVDAYSAFVTVIADAHLSSGSQPSADAMQKLEEASKSVDTDQVRAASQRVQDWFQNKCGK